MHVFFSNILFFQLLQLIYVFLDHHLLSYRTALCQIRGLEKAFKKQNNGQSVPKMLVLNASCIAFDRPEQTLKIYIQYSTYFACNNDLCSAVLGLTNLLGDVFLSFLPHLSLEEGI